MRRSILVAAAFALGGARLAEYFDCGTGMTGSPNANNFRLRVSLLTSLKPAANGGTLLQTQASAVGTSMEGASKDPVPCRSRGALEARIASLIGERVGG